MIFKRSANAIKSVLALSIFLLFPGCTDFLQGKPKKQNFIEIKKDNLACVKDISNKFKIFIQSGATDQEVDRTFECIDFTLLELQNRAEGRADKNSFSNEDVFKIFNQFLHEAQISQDATNDLLKLKAGLIGGQEDQITKPEMTSLRELLKKVQVEVHQLIPFVKIYGLQKGQRDFTKQTIEDAFKQLASSANKIFKATQLTRSGYQFEDFKKLMTSLNVFQGDSNLFVGLAVDVKNLLVGQESLQSESDFGIFIAGVTDLLKLYAYQNQGYANFAIIDANSMNETLDYVQEWVRILENSVQYKKTKILTQESLDPFIYKIADQGLLPISIKAKTLIDFYKVILVRVFEGGPNADTQVFSGIRPVHVLNIKRELAVFRTYMASINSLTFATTADPNTNQRIDLAEAQARIKGFNLQTQRSRLIAFGQSEQEFILNAADEYRSEFLTGRPVVYRFNKMIIAANQEVWKQSWQDLARAAYVKFLARALMIGWGNGFQSRLVQNAVITEVGLIKWYAEFK